MKLTKGKISKLYNKKKQSLKNKKIKQNNKKKLTFRKHNKINLSIKTLKKMKKMKGGEQDITNKIEKKEAEQ